MTAVCVVVPSWIGFWACMPCCRTRLWSLGSSRAIAATRPTTLVPSRLCRWVLVDGEGRRQGTRNTADWPRCFPRCSTQMLPSRRGPGHNVGLSCQSAVECPHPLGRSRYFLNSNPHVMSSPSTATRLGGHQCTLHARAWQSFLASLAPSLCPFPQQHVPHAPPYATARPTPPPRPRATLPSART